MTREEFKKKWEANDYGSGLTYMDIAQCAREWGLYQRPEIAPMGNVIYAVLLAAGCTDAENYNPDEEFQTAIRIMTRKQQIEGKARQRNPYVGGTKGDLSSALKEEFIAGAEWADKTMIDKAVEWMAENAELYKTDYGIAYGNLIMDFREAMEE